MVDSHLPPPRSQQSNRGMATGEVTLLRLAAIQGLLDLMAEPKDIPILWYKKTGETTEMAVSPVY